MELYHKNRLKRERSQRGIIEDKINEEDNMGIQTKTIKRKKKKKILQNQELIEK